MAREHTASGREREQPLNDSTRIQISVRGIRRAYKGSSRPERSRPSATEFAAYEREAVLGTGTFEDLRVRSGTLFGGTKRLDTVIDTWSQRLVRVFELVDLGQDRATPHHADTRSRGFS
jgi:hypothetical protein